MNATTEDIMRIKAGTFQPIPCDDAKKMQSVASIISQMKRNGMPDGVADYEVQKFFNENIILVHAMREGEEKVLNR